MKRREFVKGAAAAISLPFWLQGCEYINTKDYPVFLHSDQRSGHMLMKSREWKSENSDSVQAVIVGGGLAGVSAAYKLGHKDFRLFELSDRLGGTSGAKTSDGIIFSQGAHYELAYPDYYGEEVLKLFESLNIIRYEPWKKSWSFRDREHIIPFPRRQQCFENGKMRSEVIPDGVQKEQFDRLLSPYLGEMHLPTRLISQNHHHLNNITFLDFLAQNMEVSSTLERQLDYHMLDDWGGTTSQVSALAGIHYFMCRPYLTQSVDLFSPPEGNAYFINRIVGPLPSENLMINHLVSKIEKEGEDFRIEVLDIDNEKVKILKAESVIYAGQKHALKYIYEKEAHLFKQTQAPWMVINFVCKGEAGKYGFWQNEFLGENSSFLGFIDSSVQFRAQQKGKRVFTAYYCLKPEDRNYLTTIPSNKENIAAETLSYINEMLQEKVDVESCHINLMGHAMSVPVKGFLFNDANGKNPDLIYAGVDNGRLPLLYEAVDSGLLAGEFSLA